MDTVALGKGVSLLQARSLWIRSEQIKTTESWSLKGNQTKFILMAVTQLCISSKDSLCLRLSWPWCSHSCSPAWGSSSRAVQLPPPASCLHVLSSSASLLPPLSQLSFPTPSTGRNSVVTQGHPTNYSRRLPVSSPPSPGLVLLWLTFTPGGSSTS